MTSEWRPILGEDEQPTLEGVIMQALGTASLCWQPTPVGVFDTEQAIWVGEGLIKFIREAGLCL